MELNMLEARVIGCLIEKKITSTDQYPLSLNALVSACNQKTNRNPVLSLDETSVQDTLDGLRRQHLVAERSGFGSRVVKYAHLFCNTEFGDLQFTDQELAVVCELLLRGPQTPGELRTHGARLCGFSDVAEVESALKSLMEREGAPFVVRLPREPGRREHRYAHLFSGPVESVDTGEVEFEVGAGSGSGSTRERLDRLEREVAELRRELHELKALLE
jgi:uncharacterized protein YceH (UPF0502 family)